MTMAYCPTCKDRFDDVTECPNCQTKLVAELPFQTVPAENATWVEIASVGTDDEARIMQGFLQAEGIPAAVENVKFSMEPTNFGKMGEVRVYVSADDQEQAMSLLRERQREYETLDDNDDTVVTDDGIAEIDENAQPEPD
jgi:Putative prokaryotic signal transducing protein